MRFSGIFAKINVPKIKGPLFSAIWAAFLADSATYAHILHVGDLSFKLDVAKRTSLALAVRIDEVTFYGALYSGIAPGKTLHVNYDDGYWLGQNCPSGQYSETGISACTDCTIGHYCPGGAFSEPCTYGAMSCRDSGATTDAAMPSGAPVNQFLTLDQVNEFIPVTDFSQWRQISCCGQNKGGEYSPDLANNLSYACVHGTIGPGTYLFTARYISGITAGKIDSINGIKGSSANAFIAVFDHPVGYASMHANNIFQHFIDGENANYTTWTISTTPLRGWGLNTNATNITNLTDLENTMSLCVFELK